MPKGTIQIKKRVLQGISAGMPVGVWGGTVTADRMEMSQVCVGGANSLSWGMGVEKASTARAFGKTE